MINSTPSIRYSYFSRYNFWSRQGIRGPVPWPFFGNTVDTLCGSPVLDQMDKYFEKYGRTFGSYRGTVPHLVTSDPNLLKDVLVRDWIYFADRRGGAVDGNSITDNFLVSLSGEEWKRVRSIMSPTFTSGKMKSMFRIIQDCSESMINFIAKNSHDSPIDVRHLSSCVSMDVIAKCCFATDSNSFNDPNHIFVSFAKRFFNISIWRRILIVVLPNFVRKLVNFSSFPMDSLIPLAKITEKILEKRSKDGHFDRKNQNNTNYNSDYLQLLIEASNQGSKDVDSINSITQATRNDDDGDRGDNLKKFKPLTTDEIVSNSILFFAVGYDTTASLITLVCYCLSKNLDVQSKLFSELKILFEQNGNKFNYDTISNHKYLDAVISETLRILPPVPIIERRVTENYTFKEKGIKVTKGSIVTLPIWHMHHDPNFWPHPEKFDPNRFLPDNKSNIVPYSYIPFGGGPRNCIGMRFALLVTKLTLANLIINYELKSTHETNIHPLNLKPTVDAVLFSPKNVMIKFVERN